jgi:hypothetical protein
VARQLKILALVMYLSVLAGCVMQNSVEASGGFFDGNSQENN